MNLTALQHSAFLQSLGWAIANSLWQGAILWSIYFIISLSYKNASSTFKTNCSSASLFLLFGWFLVTFFLKYFMLAGETTVANSEVGGIIPLTESVFNWHKAFETILNTLPYLSVAYLFLLIVLTFRLINSYRHIYFIKNNGLHKAGVEWRLFAEKVANHIGITKKISIWLSDHVDVPATIGFIKPVVLIPLASMNQLTVAQLEAIILHELAHIKRNDYLLNLFISLIETILFFNPFVVLLCKTIKKERENSCDDFVIQYQYDRHAYASALLSLEKSRIQNLRLALSATSGKKQLLLRIQRIMQVNNPNSGFNYGQKLIALLLVTGIICSVAWLSPEKKQHSESLAKVAGNKIEQIQKTGIEKNKLFSPSVSDTKTGSLSTANKTKKSTKIVENIDDNTVVPDSNNDTNVDDVSLVAASQVIPSAPSGSNSSSFYFNTNQWNQPLALQKLSKNNNKLLTVVQPMVAGKLFNELTTVRSDYEKLRSYIDHPEVDVNWKKVEEEIRKNLQNIEWFTNDETEQQKILEQIQHRVWQRADKEITRNERDRLEKLIRNSNQDITNLGKKVSLFSDTVVTAMVTRFTKNKPDINYSWNDDEKLYTPSTSTPAQQEILKRKTVKQQGFQFSYKLADNPCEQKKLEVENEQCPIKRLRIACANGNVFVNGKKITLAELNNIEDLGEKKLSVDLDTKHIEILLND